MRASLCRLSVPAPLAGGLSQRGVARLKYGVELATLGNDLPGAGKPSGYHEAIAGSEFQTLARIARDDHAPHEQMTELVLRVAHEPTPRGRRPHASEELRGFLGVMIPHRELRIAAEFTLRIGRRTLRLDRCIKGDDAWLG